ncbi:MAG: hypothetical protein JW810_13480 [Sedimentisphaerales bacterium]|nr:hypothetical protein [Sedimentisphaerales bacterium]
MFPIGPNAGRRLLVLGCLLGSLPLGAMWTVRAEAAADAVTGTAAGAGPGQSDPAGIASRVYVRPLGPAKIDSYPQPDGTDIAVYSGGIYLYQRRPETGGLLELRAQNAVVFYSQQAIQELLSSADPNRAADLRRQVDQVVTGVYLEGDVVLELDDYHIQAAKLYYDFSHRKALMLDGSMRFRLPEDTLPLYVRARKIRQLSEGHFLAERVKLSNDEFYQPNVWLGAGRAEIHPLDAEGPPADAADAARPYGFALRDVTANLGDLPIFYWPALSGDTASTQTPLKALHTSYNSEFGMGIESEWHLDSLLGLRRPPGTDSTLRLDEFSQRGPATGLDLDYLHERYFGDLRSYLIHDDGEDRLGRYPARKDIDPTRPLRGWAQWRHRQYLPRDWQGTFEINYFSDPTFLESWEEKEFDTEKHETVLYFKQQRDHWAFDFLNTFHLNDFEYTKTELPRAGFYVAGQDILETLTYSHDGYIARIRERAGDRQVAGPADRREAWILPDLLDQRDYAFAVSRHELSLPLHGAGFHVAPTVIGTYVYDDSSVDNSFVLGAGGLRAATQFWHVDNQARSRLWDIDRIRHVIIPEVDAFWSDSDLTGTNHPDVFHFAVRQRWQTKRGPETNKRSVDFLRFDGSVTMVEPDEDGVDLPNKFFFTRPEQQFDPTGFLNADFANLGLARRERINQNLSDHARGDWAWLISDTTAVIGSLNYDIHDGVISQANGGVAVQRSPRTSYYLGNLFIKNADPFDDGKPIRTRNANFLTAGFSYQLNRKYTLALAHQFDIERVRETYTDLVVIRKFSHWYGAFVFGLDPARDTLSFSVSFWPQGYDKATIGSRRYAGLTR